MKKRIMTIVLAVLMMVAVVGCGGSAYTQGTEYQKDRQQGSQQNNAPNNTPNNTPNIPTPTPEPQGNAAPVWVEEEPAEMFTFQFMTVEQLYDRYSRENRNSGAHRAGVEFDQGGIIITAYHGEKTQVRIPDTIEGFPVVAIDRTAFPLSIVRYQEITFTPVSDIFFPPTVRVFEYGYVEVIGQPPQTTPANIPTSAAVPHGVTHFVYSNRFGINRDVIENIKSIILPNTLIDIPDRMFEGLTSMTGITIPNSVERIGARAFDGAVSLLRIDFPDNIIDIAHDAFDGTSWLNAQPNGAVYVGNVAVTWKGASPSDGRLVIREGTTVIVDRAFERETTMGSQRNVDLVLTNITIPNSVTHIGDDAFAGNRLTNVTIGNNVMYIGERAFVHNQLTSVTIPDSVTHIGERAFLNNQLTSVTIGNGVTHIGNSAFSNNQLTSVTIPNSVTHIGISAFRSNQLTSVTIPDSVTHIGRSAFSNNQLTSITIPDSVIEIAGDAFWGNPLDEATQARIRQIQGW
jgi:hypothetical protein